jgi:AmmeMemoRadiSam system protein A
MPTSLLSERERRQLLKLARDAIIGHVKGEESVHPDLRNLSQRLWEPGATFVTLTKKGQLRGCIGSLEPRKPLADDVVEHAIAAASQDYRFPPVAIDELDEIRIEISRLTLQRPLYYDNPEDLLTKLRPHLDGVVMQYGLQRATFLPQVWEKISDPSDFLDHLCIKMGMPSDLWRHEKVELSIYLVEEFHE